MMWNWVVSTLAIGAAVVLYDGSPLKPTPTVLWDLVDRLGWVPALARLARLSAERPPAPGPEVSRTPSPPRCFEFECALRGQLLTL